MKRNSRIILLIISILTVSLACSFAQDVIGGEEQSDGPTSQKTTTTTELQDKGEDELSAADQEVEEDSSPATGGQQDEVETTLEEAVVYDTVFPLPEDVQNFIDLGDDSVNFQTSLSIEEAIAFYRQAFEAENLSERTINTEISETSFSMIFDGHSYGTIVIQGVDLGDGMTNINIRIQF